MLKLFENLIQRLKHAFRESSAAFYGIMVIGMIALVSVVVVVAVNATSVANLMLTPIKEGWSRGEVNEFNKALGLTGISHLEGIELLGMPHEPKIVIIRTKSPEFCMKNSCMTHISYISEHSVSRILVYSSGKIRAWTDRLPVNFQSVGVLEFDTEGFSGPSVGKVIIKGKNLIAWSAK